MKFEHIDKEHKAVGPVVDMPMLEAWAWHERWEVVESTKHDRTVTLSFPPAEGFGVSLNGSHLIEGSDYRIEGKRLTIADDMSLTPRGKYKTRPGDLLHVISEGGPPPLTEKQQENFVKLLTDSVGVMLPDLEVRPMRIPAKNVKLSDRLRRSFDRFMDRIRPLARHLEICPVPEGYHISRRDAYRCMFCAARMEPHKCEECGRKMTPVEMHEAGFADEYDVLRLSHAVCP